MAIRLPLFVALSAMLAFPLAARADDDEATSIFTDNGFELRRDERIFTLFAALNVAGYNAGDQARSKPFPRFAYHPLREKVRVAFAASADKLSGPVDSYLDAHPESIEAYEAAALTLGTDASFTPSDQTPRELEGLDKMLSTFAASAKLGKLEKAQGNDYRELFKKLKASVDGPFAQLRAAYHLSEEDAPNLVLVPNPLDAPWSVLARRAADGSHVVVFGLPVGGKALDLKPALKAYSALLAQEAAANVAAVGIDDALQTLKANGTLSSEVNAENMVRDSLRVAVESKLWSKDPNAEVQAAFKRGLLYTPEFLKAVTEPAEAFPASKGSFAAQVVGRVDLRKTLTDGSKTSTVSN